MINFQDDAIDISFDTETKLQSLVMGSEGEYAGYIIGMDGAVVCLTYFDIEEMRAPSAEIFLEAFLKMHFHENNIHLAVYQVAKEQGVTL